MGRVFDGQEPIETDSSSDELWVIINFYIYDAHHSYEQQYKNLEIARNFFDKNCLVYIDDYNLKSVVDGTKDFLTKYYCTSNAKHFPNDKDKLIN